MSGQLPIQARRHPLISAFAKALHGPCGVPPGARIILAVSGGADSSALLLASAALATRRTSRLEPLVVHVHHHLRREADEDEMFVRNLAAKFGLPFLAEHVTVAPQGVRRSTGKPANLLALARERRYEALARAAGQHAADFVATAHHLDDQCETVLMHLFRGCDLDGLAGMPWRRDLVPGISLVRPLLGVRRAMCEALCRAADLSWREDASNRNLDRARAALRINLLPRVEALWPGATEHVAAAADAVRSLRALMDDAVTHLFGDASRAAWPRAEIASAPPAVVMAGLRRAALTLSPNASPSRRHLEAAAKAIRDGERRPRSFVWPGNLQLVVTSNKAAIRLRRSAG